MAAINLTPGHKYILCTEHSLYMQLSGSSWGPDVSGGAQAANLGDKALG